MYDPKPYRSIAAVKIAMRTMHNMEADLTYQVNVLVCHIARGDDAAVADVNPILSKHLMLGLVPYITKSQLARKWFLEGFRNHDAPSLITAAATVGAATVAVVAEAAKGSPMELDFAKQKLIRCCHSNELLKITLELCPDDILALAKDCPILRERCDSKSAAMFAAAAAKSGPWTRGRLPMAMLDCLPGYLAAVVAVLDVDPFEFAMKVWRERTGRHDDGAIRPTDDVSRHADDADRHVNETNQRCDNIDSTEVDPIKVSTVLIAVGKSGPYLAEVVAARFNLGREVIGRLAAAGQDKVRQLLRVSCPETVAAYAPTHSLLVANTRLNAVIGLITAAIKYVAGAKWLKLLIGTKWFYICVDSVLSIQIGYLASLTTLTVCDVFCHGRHGRGSFWRMIFANNNTSLLKWAIQHYSIDDMFSWGGRCRHCDRTRDKFSTVIGSVTDPDYHFLIAITAAAIGRGQALKHIVRMTPRESPAWSTMAVYISPYLSQQYAVHAFIGALNSACCEKHHEGIMHLWQAILRTKAVREITSRNWHMPVSIYAAMWIWKNLSTVVYKIQPATQPCYHPDGSKYCTPIDLDDWEFYEKHSRV